MSALKIRLRYPALAALIACFVAGLYMYVSMNIETSLLEREIRLARYEKRDWERKNSAIRAEIARMEGEGYETIYWKLYGALPFYEDNTIIYVDLNKLHPGEIGEEYAGQGQKELAPLDTKNQEEQNEGNPAVDPSDPQENRDHPSERDTAPSEASSPPTDRSHSPSLWERIVP